MKFFDDAIADDLSRLGCALLPVIFLCYNMDRGFGVASILCGAIVVAGVVRGIMVWTHKSEVKKESRYTKLINNVLGLPYAILLISLIGPDSPMTFGLVFSVFLFAITLLTFFLKKNKTEDYM